MIRWSKRGLLCFAVLMLTAMLGVATAFAAETVHLYLKVDGAAIQGDSTQQSLGRAGSIECVSVEQAIVSTEKGRQYEVFKCVKRIDKSTPLLIKALVERGNVEATFKFFRPNPTGDGTTEQFFTVELKEALITGYQMWVPSTIEPASSSDPPLEEISFTFRSIAWTYHDGNIKYADDGKGIQRK
ncbi:MAG TPA: type VI secretion system tube protein Hcp [Symbiobacteriaceae bacterium]|nr:type VI secretion system tube protein Hcp [Symbiobacteriaceae bacterium]